MSQDPRLDEERITQRRAEVLGFKYADTSKINKRLYKDILSLADLYQMRVIPLIADAHNIHFGITTTTAQQVLKKLNSRITTSIP